MERTEPTLVPEWLKNADKLTGSGSISHSDDHAASRLARNKPFVNSSSNGHDFGRSSNSERSNASYFRRSSSSNGSGNLRPYSSFGSRNHRDRDWDKDTYDSRERNMSFLGHRDPLGNPLSSKVERDGGLRRSQSMISGKRADTWPKKSLTDSINNNGTDFLNKGSLVGLPVKKATFERDFPSLGTDERAEVGRVPSPGLSSAIQNLPVGTSSAINGEKWTSALAEVPVSSSTPVASGTHSGLNMAEAVAQGPSRAQTTPQLSIGTQRLEELAIKQSRQLIPMTPSMPKTLASISSDKQKSRVGPVSSSLPVVNHSPRGGPVKNGDVSKVGGSNVGKFQFLKPKNGVTIPVVKDNPSPTSVVMGPPNNAVPDRKPAMTILEKRPTSQARSRNDFFNLVRKKSVADPAIMGNSSSALVDTGISSDKNAIVDVNNGKKHAGLYPPIISEEKENAFLRSLGWVEYEGEDEGGLTEEEISGFYKDMEKYMNSKPSLKVLKGVRIGGVNGISSGLKSSEAKLDS